MTARANIKIKMQKNKKEKRRKVLLFLLVWASLVFSLFIAKDISVYIVDGLRLCAGTVIASVFPFMILTDLILHTQGFERIKFLRRGFELAFKINGYAINAFIIGITCGFPIGVKAAVELYKNKKISLEECQRLIGFANNTGPAFIIAGIGIGMRSSIKDGVILYISMLLSAFAIGIIFGRKKEFKELSIEYSCEPYDFSSSVKGAALNTLTVCGFVVLFSAICGVFRKVLKNDVITSFLLPLIEVTNASTALAKSKFLPDFISFLLTSFAISFSGFSVHLQASAFLRGTKISMKKYYLMKLIQGFLSVIFSFILVIIT